MPIMIGVMCMCGMQGMREIVHDTESFPQHPPFSANWGSTPRTGAADEFESVSISFQNRTLTIEYVRDRVILNRFRCLPLDNKAALTTNWAWDASLDLISL